MKKPFKIINSGSGSAAFLMEKDGALLKALSPEEAPLFHRYEWEGPSATYGYFLNPAEHLHLDKLKERKIALARRPTGGGMIFHLGDLAFSLLIPAKHPAFSLNTLANYAFVNNAVIEAIRAFTGGKTVPLLHNDCSSSCRNGNFCMELPTKYDLLIDGKKVGGAAQRRTKAGLLHQGSIQLAPPDARALAPLLRNPEAAVAAMEARSCGLADAPMESGSFLAAKKELLDHLIASLAAALAGQEAR